MKKLFILLTTFILTSCTAPQNLSESEDVQVLTTIPPLYSLTKQLTQNTPTQVANLVPAGTSVHTFQLKPSDAKNIANADLIIINGLELEHFLEDAFEGTEGEIIDTSKGINLIENEHEDHDVEESDDEGLEEHGIGNTEYEDDHDVEESDEDGHHHGAHDPHIWLNPNNAVIQATTIANVLIKKDPSRSKIYLDNLQNLKTQLLELDGDIQERIRNLQVDNYIVFHNAYSYFEKQYNIAPSASIEEFPGDEPSAQYVKNVISIIKDEDVKAIFTEPQFSPQLVTRLSNDYNLKVASLDPLGNSIDINGYFEMMGNNVKAFEEVFGRK